VIGASLGKILNKFMANYPNSIYSPRTKANRSGVIYDSNKQTVIFAEDIQNDDNEIVAIENELGLNPKGSYADVKTRLDALAAKSIFDKFRDLVHWNSIDGFTVTKDADCTASPCDSTLDLYVANVTNRKVGVRSTAHYRKLIASGKPLTIEFLISYFPSPTVSNTVWLYFGTSYYQPPYDDEDVFGFKIVDGEVYANNGKSAGGYHNTITSTGITLPDGAQLTRLRVVFTPGTDCKFYVNDVLKVTHTTDLTTVEDGLLFLTLKTTGNVTKEIYLGRVLIEKEY